MNKKYLKSLEGEEINVPAVTYMGSQKKFTPPMHRSKDGTIADTHFMKDLSLKIGAKVMLIKNIRTEDSLTNGQLGKLVGVIRDKDPDPVPNCPCARCDCSQNSRHDDLLSTDCNDGHHVNL